MPHALFIYKRGLGVYRRSVSEATQGRSGSGQEEVRKSIPPAYTRHTSSFMCVGGKLLGPSLGLAPSGLAQALFKTVNHFILQLELFRGYAGRHKP
ncbi:hypothetical protein EVT53_20680 [Salmonella enterica subsp. enterica serovar Corvallis]|uniref:Uncharacterized protein n=2 Tax=Salmonella enterica TaxID=28901 RepID=A0A722RG35_SALER|nr:hypothetical protein [Salmonella enterica]EBF2785961.1 hypothetical protein [Salmonella enterica subsp. enterica serovar Corvallis]EAO0621928.1 hypothetical protein [Salmonella enterica]ECA2824066.1 hypothetical protein [Salmonella enterica subsp. enterica serovar Corvallis]ECA3764493.1 hypothetical protein [Salmonella enterica subsp. enterica serovar Corvallis]